MELDIIYNQDCFDGIKDIPDKSIDLVVTDPPYEFIKGGMKNEKFNMGKMAADSYMNKEMADFGEDDVRRLLELLKPKFKHGFNAYFFCSEMQVIYYLKWAQGNRKRYNILVWDREVNSCISKKFFRSHIDYIVRIYDGGNSLRDCGDMDVMEFYSKIKHGKQGVETKHETEKNVGVVENLVLASSDAGDVVLDPFMGSGTTAVACVKNNRRYIGFEKSENWHGVAEKRIRNFKSQPTLF